MRYGVARFSLIFCKYACLRTWFYPLLFRCPQQLTPHRHSSHKFYASSRTVFYYNDRLYDCRTFTLVSTAQVTRIASTYPFHHGCLAFAMPPKKLLRNPPEKPRSELLRGSRTSVLLPSSFLSFPVLLMTLSSSFSTSSSAASSRCLNLQRANSETLNTQVFGDVTSCRLVNSYPRFATG